MDFIQLFKILFVSFVLFFTKSKFVLIIYGGVFYSSEKESFAFAGS